MRLLLDTHVLLWALLDDPRLSADQRAAIGGGELYISAASVWEIGIKRAIGKLDVPEELFDIAVDAGCRPLPISWTHAEAAAALPLHHADPFDRMLVAQARCEGLRLASSDAKLAAYDVDLVG
ncbi:PIN domain-containing protein [Pseudooceanicola sp. 216_PA32_1]|uniref:PIN domain-containing protein n=1 Tax=Pseudooceanicola pacificus TaxID=2676438 RepID=A0A844W6U3_9RHOB|nr:type II toxin-antitoxin system VapC family toxin [Pseudooceanicola pacificus]MWB78805.1 PIN domain-containing protein [Pseudooceanicola pacificus]